MELSVTKGAARLLVLLLAAGAAGCASSATPRPRPFPGAPPAGDTRSTGDEQPIPPVERGGDTMVAVAPRFDPSEVVRTALGFRGVPYRNGGSDPSGFDCSGFVQYVFAQHGLALPREVREQFVFGEEVRPEETKEGDLVYFSTVAKGPSHVGLIIAGDQFVHAPSSRGVVRVERFTTPYWASRLVAIKRLR